MRFGEIKGDVVHVPKKSFFLGEMGQKMLMLNYRRLTNEAVQVKSGAAGCHAWGRQQANNMFNFRSLSFKLLAYSVRN